MPAPHFRENLHVPAGFDLDLDSPVAEAKGPFDPLQHSGDVGLDPEADSDRNARLNASEEARNGLFLRPRDEVDESELETGAGHRVTAEWSQPLGELGEVPQR